MGIKYFTAMKHTHKNYVGEYHYNSSDGIFSGKIIGVKDLVTFEGDTEYEVKTAFYEAVDDYIELQKCRVKKVK